MLGLIFNSNIVSNCGEYDFSEVQENIEAKLSRRPSKEELIAHNIIKDVNNVAPFLQATQQKIKFSKLIEALDLKLESRPNREFLIEQNILKGNSVAPNIQAAQNSIKFKNIRTTMSQKLENRPTPSILIENNIMKAGIEVAPNLQSVHQTLKFQTTVATLDHKFEHRPTADDLVQHNIIKNSDLAQEQLQNIAEKAAILEPQLEHRPPLVELVNHNILKSDTSVIAPSLHATQQTFSRNMSSHKLNHKLELRPSKVRVEEQNILKGGVISYTVDKLNKLQLIDSLTVKIDQRPGLAELAAHNVLSIQS